MLASMIKNLEQLWIVLHVWREQCGCSMQRKKLYFKSTFLMDITLPHLDTGSAAATAQRHHQQSCFHHLRAFSPFHTNKMSIRCKDCLTICGQAALTQELPVFKILENIKHTYSVSLSYRFGARMSLSLTFSIEIFFPLTPVPNSTLYLVSSSVTRKAWKIPHAFPYNPVVSLPSHYPEKAQRKATFPFQTQWCSTSSLRAVPVCGLLWCRGLRWSCWTGTEPNAALGHKLGNWEFWV